MRLLSFRIKNYKSFNGEQKILFSDNHKNVTAFFGPNSSGKTNLFSAIDFYCDFILHSTDFRRRRVLSQDYFRFVRENADLPTEFGAEFETDGIKYKYNFSILRDGNVDDEKLQRDSGSGYVTIFARKSLKNNTYEGYGFSSKILGETRQDSLVLTRAYTANNKIAMSVVSGIEKIMTFSMMNFHGYTAEKVLENSKMKDKVLNFLKMADLYIQDFSVKKNEMYDKVMQNNFLSDEAMKLFKRSSYEVMTTHILRDASGAVIGVKDMSLNENESSGTNRIFSYALPVIEALEEGKVLYIDELEVNLHPRECAFIVKLFDNKNGMNLTNGQLIINTHEISLMDILGKENVYLLGKDRFESTIISKLTGARNDDRNLAKKYNVGMFGAVPRVEI